MKDVVVGLQINATNSALTFFEGTKNKAYKCVGHKTFDAPQGARWDIFDNGAVDEINNGLKDFENTAKTKINRIFYVLPLDKLKKIEGNAQMVLHPRSARQVCSRHIEKLIEQARLLSLDWHYKAIHCFPIEFKLDGKTFITPPLGVHGRKLEVKALFYVINNDYSINLDNLFQYLGRKCDKIVASSLSEASLLSAEDVKRGNFAIINVGKTKIELSCFYDFALIDTKVFKAERGTVDDALSEELSIPVSLAEELRVTYGALEKDISGTDRNIVLELQGQQREIKQSEVWNVLQKFYAELFENVSSYMKDNDFSRRLDNAFILGGWTSLTGAKEFVEKYLICPVTVPEFKSEFNGKEIKRYAASCGVVSFVRSKFNFDNVYKFSKQLWTRIHNMWEEYF